MKPRHWILALTILGVLAGCGSHEPLPVVSPSDPVVSVNGVLDDITAAGLPADHVTIWTAETDPVGLLGRPNQYVAAASFDLPDGDPTATAGRIGRGGVVEIWPDAQSAQARSTFIQNTLKAGNGLLGTEYHYLHGPVLLRITGTVPPAEAAKYGKALTP